MRGFYFFEVHRNSLGSDDMIQILKFLLPECKLFELHIELVLPQNFQYLSHMIKMHSSMWTVNYNVIKKYENELTKVWPEYGIHQDLKFGWTIT